MSPKLKNRAAQGLLALGVAVHLLFLLSLKFGWLNSLFNDSMHRFGPGGDFFSIYAAGVKARAGESVYTVGGHVAQVPYAYAFRYAPLVAYTLGLLSSLLAALNAYGLWLIVCELCLLRCIRLSVERAPDKPTACLVASLWLLFSPYYLELYVGQFTFVTASLVFWAYLSWQDARMAQGKARSRLNRMADACFALAVWLKMMPLLFLPLMLWRGRWKSALAIVAVLIVTSWVYFAHRPDDWAVFVDTNGEPTPTWHAGNQGLMALVYGLTGERAKDFADARLLVLAVLALGLGWLAFGLWRAHPARDADSRSKDAPDCGTDVEGRAVWLYAACSVAYLLGYKDMWEHHYVLLLPPLVLLVLRRERVWLWLPPFVLCALPSLFALYDVRGLGYNEDPQRYWQPAVSLLHHGWKPLASVWLFVALLWRAWGAERRGLVSARPASLASSVFHARFVAWARRGAGAFLVLLVILGGRWAGGAIRSQQRVTRVLTWPDTIFQLQTDRTACGPAALAAVCRYYGIHASEAELAALAGTRANGTTMLGLQRAAQSKGLMAEGQERSVDELAGLPRPCILYFHQGHFAVLTGIQDDRFYVADPSLGQRVWTRDQLAYLWRGELLLVGPAR